MGVVIFLLAFAAFAFYLASKGFKRQKQERLNAERSSTNISSNGSLLLVKDVSGKMYQALETSYILTSSTNLETVKSRLHFFKDLLPTLIEGSKTNGYDSIKRIAIDKYKADYYDRPVTEGQLQMIDNSAFIFSNWMHFHDECLISCYKRYADQQMKRLKELKTLKGRENRKEMISENGWKLYHSFQNTEAKQSFRPFLDELKNMQV